MTVATIENLYAHLEIRVVTKPDGRKQHFVRDTNFPAAPWLKYPAKSARAAIMLGARLVTT